MPSVYILPANEKNQKGEEGGGDVHTHAAHIHLCTLLISQSSSNGEKERERDSFELPFYFEKEIFPDNKANDYTNVVVPFRIPSYRKSSRRDLYPDEFFPRFDRIIYKA